MHDILHKAHAGAAVVEALLCSGVVAVRDVLFNAPGFRQCERNGRHGQLGSFTLCLETAFGTMIVCRSDKGRSSTCEQDLVRTELGLVLGTVGFLRCGRGCLRSCSRGDRFDRRVPGSPSARQEIHQRGPSSCALHLSTSSSEFASSTLSIVIGR